MKNKKKNNYAYIDGANLHRGVSDLGWKLDYRRFRVWLSDKYSVKRAYLFLGLIPKYKELYTHLQEAGFTLIFKEVVYDDEGRPKGNCDADLVLQVVRDIFEEKSDNAVIVTSDGDYASTVSFLIEKSKLITILSPGKTNKCSILLKRTGARIAYLDDQCSVLKLIQKEKTPSRD
jgi:uncharacterized LabA/DUF88 family protein